MLEVDGVTKRFGGVEALRDVSFSVASGEIVGLIGPNGAGKTTLFNVVTGLLTPDEGTVRHAGTDITGLAPYRVSRHGITRTFQTSRTLYTMTVLDNLLLMPADQPGETVAGALLRPAEARARENEVRDRAETVLETVALSDEREAYARELSGGQQKLLELGRALMTDPDAILLDEPLAGVAPELAPGILDRIERIAADPPAYPASSRLSSTVNSGKIAFCCGRYPIPIFDRSCVGRPEISVPRKEIVPPRCVVNPTIVLITVDFPAPFGPRIPTTSPAATDRETSRTIAAVP